MGLIRVSDASTLFSKCDPLKTPELAASCNGSRR